MNKLCCQTPEEDSNFAPKRGPSALCSTGGKVLPPSRAAGALGKEQEDHTAWAEGMNSAFPSQNWEWEGSARKRHAENLSVTRRDQQSPQRGHSGVGTGSVPFLGAASVGDPRCSHSELLPGEHQAGQVRARPAEKLLQLPVGRMPAAVPAGCPPSAAQMVCPGLSSRKLGNLAAPLPGVGNLLRLTGSPLCYLPGLPQKPFSGLIRGENTQKD